MAPVVVEEHHRTAGFYAAIFVPLVLSIALATGGFFAYRRFRHHFKYNRIIAEDGERQTLSMELPNTSAVYEKARGQAFELSSKARDQARDLGEKARLQSTEYATKARGYFKVPDTTGIRSYLPASFGDLMTRFKRTKATDEEAAKLEFELPEDKAKKEDEESSEEEDEEEEEEEVPSGKAPLLEGKAPKWGAESKKAELKTVPGAQAPYDPVATGGRAPTKTFAKK